MIPTVLRPAFRETLLNGGYNLLLGSGVSLDSHNGLGQLLRSSEQLRNDLCKVTNVSDKTLLTRAYALLTPQQRQEEIINRFSKCQPGPSVSNLPRFLWRRLFTFNIDDVLEHLYRHKEEKKQDLIPLNFDAAFEPTPVQDELQAIHLHGWVQKPESGFVFAASEYIRVMKTLNPWMHLLSEILATESFIIAGTSLNEIDLEYYLSHRNPTTPRRGRGPSILIEPNPDKVTQLDCNRYGLILIPNTFREFMDWLSSEFPSPPNISDLLVPDVKTLFAEKPSPHELIRFFSDFELVAAAENPLAQIPSPFLYGREPQWTDLYQHTDIDRSANTGFISYLDTISRPGTKSTTKLVAILDEPGTGKTTTIRRVAHTLAKSGKPVLSLRTNSKIDTVAAKACLSCVSTEVLLVIDGLADHVDQIHELLDDKEIMSKVVILAAERSYRQEYLNVVLGEMQRVDSALSPLTLEEYQQLLERYRQFGLIGNKAAVKDSREFAKLLLDDPVAIACCRILNDFRPLDSIVKSLLKAANPADLKPYICVALAQHCHKTGLRYSIAQSIAGPHTSIARLIDTSVPLKLVQHANHDEFLVTANTILGERVLQKVLREHPEVLHETFRELSAALAPHVNRKTIIRRSPESRLAGRLFDADKIVKPFLGNAAEDFYIAIQKNWEWYSRYWEQRALLVADRDLETALQYARHAVAIEHHQYPLTTLGKLLFKSIDISLNEREKIFSEAFEKLSTAIEIEARYSRISVHPFYTLLSGAAHYLELGETMTAEQKNKLSAYATEALHRFPGDAMINSVVQKYDSYGTRLS